MQQIQATDRAIAAILEDGSVVTWGDARVTAVLCEISATTASRKRDETVRNPKS